LVQERGLACACLPSEENILACIAHVFECEVELGIGNEAHVLKFATYGRPAVFHAVAIKIGTTLASCASVTIAVYALSPAILRSASHITTAELTLDHI
jgi:hypothetical protein